jgi:hypothetical protein
MGQLVQPHLGFGQQALGRRGARGSSAERGEFHGELRRRALVAAALDHGPFLFVVVAVVVLAVAIALSPPSLFAGGRGVRGGGGGDGGDGGGGGFLRRVLDGLPRAVVVVQPLPLDEHLPRRLILGVAVQVDPFETSKLWKPGDHLIGSKG